MALQANGQILGAGVFNIRANGSVYGVERLDTNGTADTTFGTDGLAVPILSGPGPELVLLVETNGDILLLRLVDLIEDLKAKRCKGN